MLKKGIYRILGSAREVCDAMRFNVAYKWFLVALLQEKLQHINIAIVSVQVFTRGYRNGNYELAFPGMSQSKF